MSRQSDYIPSGNLRITTNAVSRVLNRGGVRPLHLEQVGRRQGGILRQASSWKVRLSIDIDVESAREAWADSARNALVNAGYRIVESRENGFVRFEITREADHARNEEKGTDT